MNKPVPFQNIVRAFDFISYYDSKGKLWKRQEKDGYFHFSGQLGKDWVEVGYMKAYKGRIDQIHTAFIG